MNSASMVCPKCRVGIMQLTSFKMGHYGNESMDAYHCSKCDYGYWVPMIPKNVVISTKGTYQENSIEEQLAKEISEMSDEEMKENVDKNFHYWQNRKSELQRCIDNDEIFAITEEDQKQEIIFLKQERERLMKKLERIRNVVEMISDWDKRDKDGPTVQERYLAKGILKILNEESK
jgi:hypothetical protein